ncbi:MAG: hypothetical protein JW904_13570 [Spirochaetales bacterium]|nr:hypothetical protein [Spirochaetales bacterium]
MEKMFDILYSKFFLRDVLSIFAPGIVFMFTICELIGENYVQELFKKLLENNSAGFIFYILMILAITILYCFGLIINSLRDYLFFRFSKLSEEKFKKEKNDCWIVVAYKWVKFILFGKYLLNVECYYKWHLDFEASEKKNEYFASTSNRSVVIF